MKRFVFISLFLLILFACNTNNKKTPKKETLKNGTWILEGDAYSSLIVNDSTVTFKYDESFSRTSYTYDYFVIDSLDIQYIKLRNEEETMIYEILAKNDTLLNLMDLQFGHILTYISRH